MTDQETLVEQLHIDHIDPNPLNPRKAMHADELGTLLESIRAHGVLQPIMVRPHPKPKRTGPKKLPVTPYQIVIGERRWRAAKAAGLPTIPGSVREVDDALCLEIMLIENGRRTDLDPVEEAETYHRLHQDFHLRLEDIAGRVGKSTTAIFQRVKLMDCNADVRKALQEGNLSVSVAELIGRAVHPTQQGDALDRLAANQWEAAPSYRDAKRIVEEEFMLRLAGVPWSLNDAKLDKEAGPCALCPKRTGSQRELFPDTKAKDVCLDRVCFDGKRKAAKAARLEQAAADGSAVLEGDAATAVFDRHGQVKRSSGYVDLGRSATGIVEPGKRVRSVGDMLGKRHRPPVTVVEVPGTDRVIELARSRDVEKAMKAKGIKPKKGETAPTAPSRETVQRNQTRAKAAVYDAQVAALVAACEDLPEPLTGAQTDGTLRAIARELYGAAWQDAAEATRKRRGFPSSPVINDKPILAIIREGSPGAVLALTLELLAQAHRPKSYSDANMGFLRAVAPLYSTDLKAPATGVRDYLRKLGRRRAAKKGPKPSKSSSAKARKKPAQRPAAKEQA